MILVAHLKNKFRDTAEIGLKTVPLEKGWGLLRWILTAFKKAHDVAQGLRSMISILMRARNWKSMACSGKKRKGNHKKGNYRWEISPHFVS